MTSMWLALLPLILASALMPIEMAIVIMLLGSPGRVRTAASAVAGMIAVRLLQGLIFGMILHWGARDDTASGHGWVMSTVLLVVAILLYVTAIRELLHGGDADDPPPKWMSALSTMSPGKAFLLGAGVLLISVKLWIFTFGAIGIIGDAGMTKPENVATYVAFTLLASSTHLVIVGLAAFMPRRSKKLLDAMLRWLQDHNRVIMICLGFGFGTWLLIKALHGLGIL